MKVIIVGGVAGGASAAARLRRVNEKTAIVMYEKSPYISYANCGLPYYIGGVIKDKQQLLVQTPEYFKARLNIDVFVNHEVIAIDRFNKTVVVKNLLTNETVTNNYDKLLLAPGAKPLVPDLPGVDSPLIFTLRNVPDTLKITEFIETQTPKRALIVGAGYIGLEMAENLMQRGLEVTVVEMMSHVIASIDQDMAHDIHEYIRQNGVNLILNEAVSEFITENGMIKAQIGHSLFEFDMVIMSVGVLPDTKLAQEAGLIVNARNALIVNEYLQTNDADIYAVGDAILVKQFTTRQESYIPLAGPANRQGRIVADNINGANKQYLGSQGTAILKFFDLTVATTGLSETSARQAGYAYEKVFQTGLHHSSYYPGAQPIIIKLIFQKVTGVILGAQIIGFQGVDKRIDVIATAMRAQLKAPQLSEIDLAYAPPFGSSKDPINMVGYLAENVLEGKLKQYFVEDLDYLPRDGTLIYLDIRDASAYQKGHFPTSINIPFDQLRDSHHLLDIKKPIYIVCDTGMRSYLAMRTLSQLGYNAYSLAGGVRLLKQKENDQTATNLMSKLCQGQ